MLKYKTLPLWKVTIIILSLLALSFIVLCVEVLRPNAWISCDSLDRTLKVDQEEAVSKEDTVPSFKNDKTYFPTAPTTTELYPMV